jgi:hypothetical protein
MVFLSSVEQLMVLTYHVVNFLKKPTHLFIEHEHIGLDVCKELTSQLGYRLDWNDFCNSMYIK